MGWGSGTYVFEGVWSLFRDFIPDDKKVEVCARLIHLLRMEDWDTLWDVDSEDYPEYEEAIEVERKFYKD